jgi:mannitol/fructose-specific phosphotransferase system IIA component (Ntr-type)
LKTNKAQPQTLYLQREADYLLNALDQSRILRLEISKFDEVSRVMSESLAEAYPSLTPEFIHRHVMERESVVPTTLGHGVALPHCKIEGISHSACAVALVPEGVHLPDEDEAIRLVFMLVSPAEEPEMHLAVLGEIARLCADVEVREMLIGCARAEDVMPVIRQYRRQHTPFADARG